VKRAHKKFSYICFFISILIITSISYARAAHLNISVKLRCLATDECIDAEVGICTEGISAEFEQKRAGEYQFEGTLGPEDLQICEFNLHTQNPFFSRTIPIRIGSFEEEVRKSFKFYIANASTEFTYGYLRDGLKYFARQDYDRALAHYEVAFIMTGQNVDSMSRDITEYSINLAYNYARALHNSCIHLKYNNDDLAIELFQRLIRLYEHYKKFFTRLHITKSYLTGALNDLSKNKKIVKYGRIPVYFAKGKYLEAANLATEGLGDFQTNSKVFCKIGLTKDRLLTDAGVSYLKAAEKMEKTGASAYEVRTLLISSQEFLSEVKALDPIKTKKNLEVIGMKLQKQ